MKSLKTLLCGGMLAMGIFVLAGCGDDGPAEIPEDAQVAPPAGMEMKESDNYLTEE
jgi:predicted small lipoprotein YifL